jgi:hypothetical protein
LYPALNRKKDFDFMEEIDKRLRDATDACLAAYGDWAKSKKNSEVREKLQEAVHELRKVAARLEIEMAVSERDEMASKPLPIPPHRSSKKRPGEYQDFGGDDDAFGNAQEGGQSGHGGGHGGGGQGGGHESGVARTMQRRRRPGGPGHQGGGHQGGGHQGNHNNQPGNNGNNNGNNGNAAG